MRTADGFADAYQAFVDGAGTAHLQHRIWRTTDAIAHRHRRHGNVYLGEYGLVALSASDGRRDRIHRNLWLSELKKTYLPKLVSGEWPGTMNLTEPHAGSDLAELRCRAERENGHYRIKGQKIYISYGEHDMSENIIHSWCWPACRTRQRGRKASRFSWYLRYWSTTTARSVKRMISGAHPSSIARYPREPDLHHGLRRQRGRDRLSSARRTKA